MIITKHSHAVGKILFVMNGPARSDTTASQKQDPKDQQCTCNASSVASGGNRLPSGETSGRAQIP